MSKNLPIPRILQPQYMEQLNDLVYTSTGCFLFLTSPKDSFFHMPGPKSYRECYVYDIINLYKVYYDFAGKYFLWVCLQDKQLPAGPEENAPSDFGARLSLLRFKRAELLKHYKFICAGARHILAHGIFYDVDANNYIDPKIEDFIRWSNSIIGKDSPSSDENWKALAERIVSDSDSLFTWIEEWAQLWSYCDKAKEAMKNRFYHGNWNTKTSKCTLRPDRRIKDITKETPYILYPCGYVSSDNPLSNFEKAFSEQLVKDSCRKIASLAGPNVEVAPNGNPKKWSSSKPDNYWQSLCSVINFFGIDRVKEELLDNTPSKCPDVYQIYLNGLFSAAARLPKKSTSIKSSTKHFDRSRRFRR